VIKRKQLCQ